jgi:sensor histidine kinase YesM
MDANHHRKLFGYSSLFITLVLNLPKLLALRKDGVIARLWHFDGIELCFQSLITFAYCIVIFYFNKERGLVFRHPRSYLQKTNLALQNLGILAVFFLFGETIQHFFFQLGAFPAGGYGFRFTISLLLVIIELRIYFLLQDTREKEIENEHLRNAWLQSQLTLLKGQLNPHFLFNSLSSLSAIVREDPRLAQRYISHLSRIFRYSLQQATTDLVPLTDELAAVKSYAELMKMRYEEGFHLTMPSEEIANGRRILPMSLQLLVENALKHNTASAAHPLHIVISLMTPGAPAPSILQIRNNRQALPSPEPGAGIGLSNLNERYHILLQQDITITTTETDFIVQLPLA